MDSRGNNPALGDPIFDRIATLTDPCFIAEVKSIYLHGTQVDGEVQPDSEINLIIVLHSTASSAAVEQIDEAIRAWSTLDSTPSMRW